MSEVSIGKYAYKKEDLIGHGSFAIVFKGRVKEGSKPVAVKCISQKHMSKTYILLQKEINILKQLTHPNIVQLYDCHQDRNGTYLIMEFCNGGDLHDYLSKKKTIPEKTIYLFLRQIAAALKLLDEKNIVHRDLKPQNILLAYEDGLASPQPHDISVKVADFGFARHLIGEDMAATLCGSPMYMAPEVMTSQTYDSRADIWSLGTIIYQCLVGRAPFTAPNPQKLRAMYEQGKNIQPNIPETASPALRNLLANMLKRDPRERMTFANFFQHPFLNEDKCRVFDATCRIPSPSRRRSQLDDARRGSAGSSFSPDAWTPNASPAVAAPASPLAARPPAVSSPATTQDLSSTLTSNDSEMDEGFVIVPREVDDYPVTAKRTVTPPSGPPRNLALTPAGANIYTPDKNRIVADSYAVKFVVGSPPHSPSTPGMNAGYGVKRQIFNPQPESGSLPRNVTFHTLSQETHNQRFNPGSGFQFGMGAVSRRTSMPSLPGTAACRTEPNLLALVQEANLGPIQEHGAGGGGQPTIRPFQGGLITHHMSSAGGQSRRTRTYSEPVLEYPQRLSTSPAGSSESNPDTPRSPVMRRLSSELLRVAFSPNRDTLHQQLCDSRSSDLNELPIFSVSPKNDSPAAQTLLERASADLSDLNILSEREKELVEQLTMVLSISQCLYTVAISQENMMQRAIQESAGEFLKDRNWDLGFPLEINTSSEKLMFLLRSLEFMKSCAEPIRECQNELDLSNNTRNIIKQFNTCFSNTLQAVQKLCADNPQYCNLSLSTEKLRDCSNRLIYAQALQICRDAALDEQMGLLERAFTGYRNGQLLLSCLLHDPSLDRDRPFIENMLHMLAFRVNQVHVSLKAAGSSALCSGSAAASGGAPDAASGGAPDAALGKQ